jgi:hypothetical protein
MKHFHAHAISPWVEALQVDFLLIDENRQNGQGALNKYSMNRTIPLPCIANDEDYFID